MTNKLPILSSKPMPSVEHLGRQIIVRPGAGTKSKVYVCVLNSGDGYEWLQIGVST